MAIDRNVMLSQQNVFGVFATFRLRPSWDLLAPTDRQDAAMDALAVIERHADTVLVDSYLTRGFSASCDFFFRIHVHELDHAQTFLLAWRDCRLGRMTDPVDVLKGITRPLQFITKEKSAGLYEALFAAGYEGDLPRFAIVIPVTKNAEWWTMNEADRLAALEGHTRPTLGHLVSVKRKLYHSAGLDDVDFITYFETGDLGAFHELALSLKAIRENLYHTRWGAPTVLGSIRSPAELFELFAR